MSISINTIPIEKFIIPPEINLVHRSRSVTYALDGTAKEDRLGNYKKQIVITFALLKSQEWEKIRPNLAQKTISVNASVGGISATGTYRLVNDTLPTPILVVRNGSYYCKPFTITLEEI